MDAGMDVGMGMEVDVDMGMGMDACKDMWMDMDLEIHAASRSPSPHSPFTAQAVIPQKIIITRRGMHVHYWKQEQMASPGDGNINHGAAGRSPDLRLPVRCRRR